MKISKLIKQLQDKQERNGDLEVIMQATTLQNGYKTNKHGLDQVFQSTVETLEITNMGDEECLQLFWQC